MVLDDIIEKVLMTLNTEVKQVLQVLVTPSTKEEVIGVSGPELADRVRAYVRRGWMLDNSTIIKICKNLSNIEAFSRLINERRTKERPAKYYFITNNGEQNSFRPLAALALRTVADYGLSFYSIFGCFGGTKIARGSSNKASKGIVYIFKTLLGFYDINDISKKDDFSEDSLSPGHLDYGSIRDLVHAEDATVRNMVGS